MSSQMPGQVLRATEATLSEVIFLGTLVSRGAVHFWG